MTKELQEALEKDLEGAIHWPDEKTRTERIMRAQSNIMLALIDCSCKTAERVKTLVADMTTIKADLAPCKESDREYRETKLKAKGAKWAFASIFAIASVFGPIVAIKICKIVGILWSPAS